MAVTPIELARELQELIAALDRRVPRLERASETAIARDAAELRARAVERLAQLADDPSADTGALPFTSADRIDGKPE